MIIRNNNPEAITGLNGAAVDLPVMGVDIQNELRQISDRCQRVGLTATICTEPDNCLTYNICDGDISLLSGTHVQATYMLLADFARLIELKFVENQLRILFPRIAAVGWRIVMTRNNLGYVEFNHASHEDFNFTYDDFWRLKTRLEITEARQYLISHSHLAGFDHHIEVRNDCFVVDRLVLEYTMKNVEKTIYQLQEQGAGNVPPKA